MPEVDYKHDRDFFLRGHGNTLVVTFNTEDFNDERMRKLIEKNPKIRVIIDRLKQISQTRSDLYSEETNLETKLEDEVLKTLITPT